MKTQIIQDHNGLPTGVFIPIEDWENIKKQYPGIETMDSDLPQWQKDVLDSRLADMKNSGKTKPVDLLYKILDGKYDL